MKCLYYVECQNRDTTSSGVIVCNHGRVGYYVCEVHFFSLLQEFEEARKRELGLSK